jgi:fatty-acyl-CoA synthase
MGGARCSRVKNPRFRRRTTALWASPSVRVNFPHGDCPDDIMKVEMTTLDFLDRATDLYDDVVGVIADDGREYTYAEFGDRVNQLTRALADHGVERGDRVAMLASNTHYFLEAMYATNQLGAVYVPMNYRLTPDDYRYILTDCEATTVIADHEYADKIQRIHDDVPADTFVGYEADRIGGDWIDYTELVDDYPAGGYDRPEIR